jgi:hypothetical protein
MRSVLLVVGTIAGCSTYAQHRAALVPHATPVQTTGQPAAWRGTATLGASNAADLGDPGVGDPSAGVAIPGRQLRGSLGIAATPNLTLSAFVEEGLASSAQPVKPTLPPLDDEGVTGKGVGAYYSVPVDAQFRLGLALELTAWDVPWVEYSQCIDNCSVPSPVTMSSGTSGVLQYAIGIVPSYRHDDWTFFGGITGRTHPTIREKAINHGESPEVEEGYLNAIVHAGVAYEAGEAVQFLVELHHDLTADPVAYAPAVGFSIAIGLGERLPKRSQPPAAPVQMMSGAPGVAQPYPAPTSYPRELRLSAAERRAQAVELRRQAEEQARRGECPSVKRLDERVRRLDAEYHATVFTNDALIAYCVTP